MNIEKRRNEIIEELWHTGRINGLYMGIASTNKTNPLKVYIKRWLLVKGIRTNLDTMIEDFYSELFVHISNIKTEKLVELAENEKHLTAMICWIAKCHLFQERSEKKKHPNVSYFEKLKHNAILNNEDGVEADYFAETEDKEDNQTDFYKQYNIEVEDILEQMTADELSLFNEVAFKKGRILNAEKSAWEKKETDVYNIVNRIKYNKN